MSAIVEPPVLRPETLSDALAGLARPGAVAVAGGTAVALLLKNRLLDPEALVLLGHVGELGGLTTGADAFRIGATTSLFDMHRAAPTEPGLALLAGAARLVGNSRVRNRATIGGSLVHADPREDMPTVLLALGARLHLASKAGERELPLDGFFTGFLETAIREDELLLTVEVPAASTRTAYVRFTPHSFDDYPTVAVAASLAMGADGAIADARIAVAGAASTHYLVPGAAELLRGTRATPDVARAVAGAAMDAADASTDHRGSADYKRAMVGVWCERAVRACVDAGVRDRLRATGFAVCPS